MLTCGSYNLSYKRSYLMILNSIHAMTKSNTWYFGKHEYAIENACIVWVFISAAQPQHQSNRTVWNHTAQYTNKPPPTTHPVILLLFPTKRRLRTKGRIFYWCKRKHELIIVNYDMVMIFENYLPLLNTDNNSSHVLWQIILKANYSKMYFL